MKSCTSINIPSPPSWPLFRTFHPPYSPPPPSCHTLPHISPRKMSSNKLNFFSLQVIFSRKLVNSSISKADPLPLLTSPTGPNSWIQSPSGISLVTTLFNFGQKVSQQHAWQMGFVNFQTGGRRNKFEHNF